MVQDWPLHQGPWGEGWLRAATVQGSGLWVLQLWVPEPAAQPLTFVDGLPRKRRRPGPGLLLWRTKERPTLSAATIPEGLQTGPSGSGTDLDRRGTATLTRRTLSWTAAGALQVQAHLADGPLIVRLLLAGPLALESQLRPSHPAELAPLASAHGPVHRPLELLRRWDARGPVRPDTARERALPWWPDGRGALQQALWLHVQADLTGKPLPRLLELLVAHEAITTLLRPGNGWARPDPQGAWHLPIAQIATLLPLARLGASALSHPQGAAALDRGWRFLECLATSEAGRRYFPTDAVGRTPQGPFEPQGRVAVADHLAVVAALHQAAPWVGLTADGWDAAPLLLWVRPLLESAPRPRRRLRRPVGAPSAVSEETLRDHRGRWRPQGEALSRLLGDLSAVRGALADPPPLEPGLRQVLSSGHPAVAIGPLLRAVAAAGEPLDEEVWERIAARRRSDGCDPSLGGLDALLLHQQPLPLVAADERFATVVATAIGRDRWEGLLLPLQRTPREVAVFCHQLGGWRQGVLTLDDLHPFTVDVTQVRGLPCGASDDGPQAAAATYL